MKWHPIYQAQIGNDKILKLELRGNSNDEKEFIESFEAAAKSNPKSLQEFFNTLNKLQQLPSQESSISISLKNIKIYDRLSEETIAFSADLYINKTKAGAASNTGHGGNTLYIPYDDRGRLLIKKAEEWCKAQPPEILKDVPTKGHDITIPQSLENYIDTIVSNFQKTKIINAFNKKLSKDEAYNIVFGIPGRHYKKFSLPLLMTDMLADAKGRPIIAAAIEKIIPQLEDGEKILNTNIPTDMLPAERKRNSVLLKQLPISNKKGKSI